MRNLFITYLVLNLVLEGIAAVTLVGAGLGLFTIARLESGMWSMNYGFAAIAIASALFWVWPHRSKREVVGPVLGMVRGLGLLVTRSGHLVLNRRKGKNMRIAVMLGLMLALSAACTNDEIQTDDSPQAAAEAFLLLIDHGNYEESWSEASAWLRDNVDANQWAEHAGSYRQPLGIVDDRKLNSIEFQDSLEDMPAGDYAFVIFDSSLADNGSTSEMVGLMLDDDSMWRVIGYQTL